MIDTSDLNPSTLEISWKAIEHNLAYFNSKIEASTKRMFMIKASAYGNGALELAKRFESNKSCEYFGVAYPNEGVELRQSGIDLPILVLNPSLNSWSTLLKYSLEPEIHTLDSLNSFTSFLNKKTAIKEDAYPIHLKFNTGMNRLGIEEPELGQVINFLKEAKGLRVRSIMTHLSSAGLESEDDFTLIQLKKFERIIQKLSSYLPKDVLIHALNSHATERFPEFQYNMVRLGIGLYGASSVPNLKQNLIPICNLKTIVSAVRKVNKGESIGYSRSGRAPSDGYVATIAIGYADGFTRNLGNGAWHVEIDGNLYPTIGNICMDLSMVFTGDTLVYIGDEAIIFGGLKSIHDYAESQQTITYETMTSIGSRVKRILVD